MGDLKFKKQQQRLSFWGDSGSGLLTSLSLSVDDCQIFSAARQQKETLLSRLPQKLFPGSTLEQLLTSEKWKAPAILLLDILPVTSRVWCVSRV